MIWKQSIFPKILYVNLFQILCGKLAVEKWVYLCSNQCYITNLITKISVYSASYDVIQTIWSPQPLQSRRVTTAEKCKYTFAYVMDCCHHNRCYSTGNSKILLFLTKSEKKLRRGVWDGNQCKLI